MKTNKPYTQQQIKLWSFGYACAYRESVAKNYLTYTDEELKVIDAAQKLINAPYKHAVSISIEGVVLDEIKLEGLILTEEELKIITRFRTIVMKYMMALPPAILKNMQTLRTLFGNY